MGEKIVECRLDCGACCIAISISSPLPGMPLGKRAGLPCIHLQENGLCALHDSSLYPDVCRNFQADEDVCGKSREEARYLSSGSGSASLHLTTGKALLCLSQK